MCRTIMRNFSNYDKQRNDSFFNKKTESIPSSNLEKIVTSSNGGTWISNKIPNTGVQLPQSRPQEFIQQLEASLVGLIKDLRNLPDVINFDKYPIFSNDEAFEAGLKFLIAYFPEQIAKVANGTGHTPQFY